VNGRTRAVVLDQARERLENFLFELSARDSGPEDPDDLCFRAWSMAFTLRSARLGFLPGCPVLA